MAKKTAKMSGKKALFTQCMKTLNELKNRQQAISKCLRETKTGVDICLVDDRAYGLIHDLMLAQFGKEAVDIAEWWLYEISSPNAKIYYNQGINSVVLDVNRLEDLVKYVFFELNPEFGIIKE